MHLSKSHISCTVVFKEMCLAYKEICMLCAVGKSTGQGWISCTAGNSTLSYSTLTKSTLSTWNLTLPTLSSTFNKEICFVLKGKVQDRVEFPALLEIQPCPVLMQDIQPCPALFPTAWSKFPCTQGIISCTQQCRKLDYWPGDISFSNYTLQ